VLYRQHQQQQIGAGTPQLNASLKTRLVHIRDRGMNADQDLEQGIDFRVKKLNDFQLLDIPPDQLSYLVNAIRHFKKRRRMLRRSKFSRFFLITGEFVMLRYYKYSGSNILDPVRDLLHRRIKNNLS